MRRKTRTAASIVATTALAYFTASGLTTLAAGPRAPPLAPTTTLQELPEQSATSPDGRSILARNIFESRRGGAVTDAFEVCPASLKLVSTVVASDPSWSFAAIDSGGRTRLYRVGGLVEPGGTVARIGWRSVALSARGSERGCSLEMFAGRENTRGIPVPVVGPGPIVEGIRNVDGAVEIDRALVERILEDPMTATASARLRPHRDAGTLDGMQIFGIRRGGILDALGLANGDVLHAVEGLPLADPRTALEAIDRLRSARRLTLRLTRRGIEQELEYRIH